MPTETKCKICNIVLATKQEKIEHEFSLMHHLKLDQGKKKKKHSCSLCSVNVGSLKNYLCHLNGAKHIKLLEWQRQQWKKRPPNDADVPIVIDKEEADKSSKKEKIVKVKVQKVNGTLNSKAFSQKATVDDSAKPLVKKTLLQTPNTKKSPEKSAPLSASPGQEGQARAQNFESLPTQQEADSMSWRATYHVSQNNIPVWRQDFQPHFNQPRHDFPQFANDDFDWRSRQQLPWGYDRFRPPPFFDGFSEFYSDTHHRFDYRPQHMGNQPPEFVGAPGVSDQVDLVPTVSESEDSGRKSNGDRRGGDGKTWSQVLEANSRRQKEDNSSFGSHSSTENRRGSDRHSPNDRRRADDSRWHVTSRHDRRSGYVDAPSCPSQYTWNRKDRSNDRNTRERPVHKPEVLDDRLEIGGRCMNNIKVTVTSKVDSERAKEASSGKRVRESKPPDKATVSKKAASDDKRGQLSRSAERLSPGRGNAHTFFVSSDSNGDEDEEGVSSPPKKRRSSSKSGDEISSYNKDLINRLVNFPRTRKQQLQLGKWIQEHTRSKKKLILPRFNLQLASTPAEKDEDSVVEGMVCEVVDNLPEHVFKELVEVLNGDCGLQFSEDRQDDSASLPPWLHFLKSLSRAPSPSGLLEVGGRQDLVAAGLLSVVQTEASVLEQPASNVEPSSIMASNVEPSSIMASNEKPTGGTSSEMPISANNVENAEAMTNSATVAQVAPELNMEPLLKEIKSEPPDPPVEEATENMEELQNFETTNEPFVSDINMFAREEQEDPTASLLLPSEDVPVAGLSPRMSQCNTPVVENREDKKLEEKVGFLQQGIVSRLMDISRKEELLTHELQQVQEMICKAQKWLTDLTAKKKGIECEELELRSQRLKLLEVLQGSMVSGQSPSDDATQLGSSIHDPSSSTSTSSPTRKRPAKLKKNAAPKKGTAQSGKKAKNVKGSEPKLQKKAKKKKMSALAADAEFLSSLPSPADLGFNAASDSVDLPFEKLIQSLLNDPAQISTGKSSTAIEESENVATVDPLEAVVSENETVRFDSFKAHDSAIIELKVCGNFLYTCSTDMFAKRWDVRNPKDSIDYGGHGKTVSALQVTTLEGNKAFVFTASHDGFLRCFEAWSGTCLNQFDAGLPIICMTKSWGKLYLGLNNGTILPFSITSNRFLEVIHCSHSPISKIITASEGAQRLLCVASYDETVTIRNVSTGLLVRCLEGKIKPPSFMQVSGSYIYISTAEKKIVVHDLSSGKLHRVIKCQSSSTGLCISGDYIFTCSYDGLIRCYRKKSWMLHALFYGAGKSMTMCMEISERQVYTGNRHGFLEGFSFDPSLVIPCKFQNCNFPFGRVTDLKHHVKHDHLPSVSSTCKECPWRECGAQLYGSCNNERKNHILMHCVST